MESIESEIASMFTKYDIPASFITEKKRDLPCPLDKSYPKDKGYSKDKSCVRDTNYSKKSMTLQDMINKYSYMNITDNTNKYEKATDNANVQCETNCTQTGITCNKSTDQQDKTVFDKTVQTDEIIEPTINTSVYTSVNTVFDVCNHKSSNSQQSDQNSFDHKINHDQVEAANMDQYIQTCRDQVRKENNICAEHQTKLTEMTEEIERLKHDIQNIYTLYNENINQRKDLFEIVNSKIRNLNTDVRKLTKMANRLSNRVDRINVNVSSEDHTPFRSNIDSSV